MIIANILEPSEYFQLGFVSRLLTYILVSVILSSATEIRNKAEEKINGLNEALRVLNKISKA